MCNITNPKQSSSKRLLEDKFRNILNDYNENELYNMGNQVLNNLFEDIENYEEIEKVVASA